LSRQSFVILLPLRGELESQHISRQICETEQCHEAKNTNILRTCQQCADPLTPSSEVMTLWVIHNISYKNSRSRLMNLWKVKRHLWNFFSFNILWVAYQCFGNFDLYNSFTPWPFGTCNRLQPLHWRALRNATILNMKSYNCKVLQNYS
jgi:hypothetical protein